MKPKSYLIPRCKSIDHFNVYNNLGLVKKYKNEYEAALKNFKRAICIKPNSQNLYFNLGETYWKKDEF